MHFNDGKPILKYILHTIQFVNNNNNNKIQFYNNYNHGYKYSGQYNFFITADMMSDHKSLLLYKSLLILDTEVESQYTI